MDGLKSYKIVINGLEESIASVDKLNASLAKLKTTVDGLKNTTINVGGKTGGGGGNVTSLSAEEKVQKQIIANEQKLEQMRSSEYQTILNQKAALTEVNKSQKAIAAQERLVANAYSNTMAGLKQELQDINTVREITPLGDEKMAGYIQRAKQITDQLKEIEMASGSFGRNVGNYTSALDGLKDIEVTIGNTTEKFHSYREATRSLSQALTQLEDQGQKETQQYKDLEKALNDVSKAQQRFNSTMNDAKTSSKVMDDLLDTMQSYTALWQVGQGAATLFGMDSSEMQKQIAKLMALQNIMKGIEVIRKQMNTGEGLGGILAKDNAEIDKMVAGLFGVNAGLRTTATQSKAAQMGMKGLAFAVKGVNAAFKAFGPMIALSVVASLLSDISEKVKSIFESPKAVQNLGETINDEIDRYQEAKENLDTLQQMYFNGYITGAQYAKTVTDQLTASDYNLASALSDLGKVNPFDPLSDEMDNALKKFTNMQGELDELYKKGKKFYGKQSWWSALIQPNPAEQVKDVINTRDIEKDYVQTGKDIANSIVIGMNSVMKDASNELTVSGTVSPDLVKQISSLRELVQKPEVATLFDKIEDFADESDHLASKMTGFVRQFNKWSDTVVGTGDEPIKQLRIDAMADGLEKELAQIELNKSKELAAVANNEEAKKLIEQKYQNEATEARKKYYEQQAKDLAQAQDDLNSLRIQLMAEGLEKELATLMEERRKALQAIRESGIYSAEREQLTMQVYSKKELELRKQWARDMEEVYRDMYANIRNINEDAAKDELDAQQKALENLLADRKNGEWRGVINPDDAENTEALREYYSDILEIETEFERNQATIEQQRLDQQYNQQKREEELRFENVIAAKDYQTIMEEYLKFPSPTDEDYATMEENLRKQLTGMTGELADAYNQGKLTFKNFIDIMQQQQEAHQNAMTAMEKKYTEDSTAITRDSLEKRQQAYADYYSKLISLIKDDQQKISDELDDEKGRTNFLGIPVGRKDAYNKAVEGYKQTLDKVKAAREQLKADLKADKITAEDFFTSSKDLTNLEKETKDAIKGIKKDLANLPEEMAQAINQYIQLVGQTINEVMGAVSEIRQNAIQAEIDGIEKDIDRYEKMLDRQKEITQRYTDDINDIEDELSEARGDRRDFLIDQLNAENMARRQSLEEEKRLQAEQEKLEKQKEKKERELKMEEWRDKLRQATINAALSISAASVNTWPMPAIAMMAAAAAAGAAQVAVVAKNKPKFKDGGVIQGPSHQHGGVQVLGGQAEVEGGEFITNKRTTKANLGLLEYINSKKGKVGMDELMDYYRNGGKVRKNLTSMFANGGQLPEIAENSASLGNALMSAFVDYSNRPIYVSVREIETVQGDMRRAEALSGLKS